MNTNHRQRFGRAAAALVAAGMLSMLSVAMPAAAVDPYNIDPTKTGDIFLTKYSTPENEVTTQQGTGKENPTPPTAGSVALDGAKFQLYKVDKTGMDLTTGAGWSELQNLITTVGPNPSQAALAGVSGVSVAPQGPEKTTLSGGKIEWRSLPLGLYYVTETFTPAGHKASAPFFVTLPMTDPVNLNAWMYQVYVYPKNAQDSTVKIPMDTDVHVPGDTLAWEIRTKIPATTVNKMIFEDVLDPALNWSSAEVKYGDSWASGTALAASDFTATYDAATRKVTVTLTPTGLAKINLAPGKTVFVHINTVVNDKYVGLVDNQATVITNKPGSTTETEQVTTPTTESKYGKLTVNKIDSKTKQPLSGAKFAVYYSHVAGPNLPTGTDPKTSMVPTNAVCDMTAAGVTSCTDELRYSDFAEGTQLSTGDSRWNYYWLVETKAPNGFELLTSPIGFQITKDNTNSAFELPAITVENVQRGGGLVLPFTGGAGSVIFIAGGIALLAGGITLMLIRTRRKTAAEAEAGV